MVKPSCKALQCNPTASSSGLIIVRFCTDHVRLVNQNFMMLRCIHRRRETSRELPFTQVHGNIKLQKVLQGEVKGEALLNSLQCSISSHIENMASRFLSGQEMRRRMRNVPLLWKCSLSYCHFIGCLLDVFI